MQNPIDYITTVAPRKGAAIASLVLGIISIPTLGLCFAGGITGLILGIVALGNAKSKPAVYGGKGIAVAGIITSSLSLLIAVPGVMAAIAIPNLIKSAQAAREPPHSLRCRRFAKLSSVIRSPKAMASSRTCARWARKVSFTPLSRRANGVATSLHPSRFN